MKKTFYFIRHAQSSPSADVPFSDWPLSETGEAQARTLGALLPGLGIEKIYSSPFTRCLRTVDPFVEKAKVPVTIENDLRERLIDFSLDHIASPDAWRKSWDDFSFALPGCESSLEAQDRFARAVTNIAGAAKETTFGVSSHGNVIALFFNYLNPAYLRPDAEKILNPDILKVSFDGGRFEWHHDFVLPGLSDIATHHSKTKIRK